MLLRRSISNKPIFFSHLNKCDEILDDRFAAKNIFANISRRTTGVWEEVLEAENLISFIHQFIYILSKIFNMQYPIPTMALHITVSMLELKALPSKQNVVYLNPPPPRYPWEYERECHVSYVWLGVSPWAYPPLSVSPRGGAAPCTIHRLRALEEQISRWGKT